MVATQGTQQAGYTTQAWDVIKNLATQTKSTAFQAWNGTARTITYAKNAATNNPFRTLMGAVTTAAATYYSPSTVLSYGLPAGALGLSVVGAKANVTMQKAAEKVVEENQKTLEASQKADVKAKKADVKAKKADVKAKKTDVKAKKTDVKASEKKVKSETKETTSEEQQEPVNLEEGSIKKFTSVNLPVLNSIIPGKENGWLMTALKLTCCFTLVIPALLIVADVIGLVLSGIANICRSEDKEVSKKEVQQEEEVSKKA